MKVVGQTLFLGASVVSFSSNIGWGSSNSSITVELIEDLQPFGRTPFKKFDIDKSADYSHSILADTENSITYSDGVTHNISSLPSGHPFPIGGEVLGSNFYSIPHYSIPDTDYVDDHYYTCEGEDCYVDELGRPYSTSTTKKEKNIPGKIYYQWVDNRFVSKYWYNEDPGFFPVGTRINPNGEYEPDLGRASSSDLYIYDIINTPVYFKFDNFEFIGLVKNWERNNRSGSITYSVTIESFNSLLDDCYVILDRYAGSIFGKKTSVANQLYNIRTKGSPVNNVNTDLFSYDGSLEEGNIPNIFNVYGFLESFGLDFFGGSNYNDNGISVTDVLQGVSALTSSHNRLTRDFAYSPFGRILTKTIATIDGPTCPNIYNFGIISPLIGSQRFPINAPNTKYNAFSLDLSDIGRLISEYRIKGSKSISSLLREVSEASGTDYTIRVVPAMVDESLYQFVIKVISVDRTEHRSPYSIRSIIKDLEDHNYSVSNSGFGQETNDNITNKFIIGGPQQRLLQVKNYRLSYNQTNYVYNPILKKFISLNKPWNKARVPDVNSVRNPIISNLTLGGYLSNRININDDERNIRFSTTDNNWEDTEVSYYDSSESILKGNYQNSVGFDSGYDSHIVTENDLNEDVQTATKKPCIKDESIITDRTSEIIDTTCQYFTPKKCPKINKRDPKCEDQPDREGGTEWGNDPTLDAIPDFDRGGFVPVTGYDQPGSRYLNLHNDWICPYFGRALENIMPVADDTNEYRSVRPVFLDIWTNQIVVGFSMHELPQLSIGEPISLYDQSIFNSRNGFDVITNGLQRTQTVGQTGRVDSDPRRNGQRIERPEGTEQESQYWNGINGEKQRVYVYGTPGFTITESEMRSALVSFESYFAYCLGKSRYSKPDLFLMLLEAYASKGELVANFDNYFELGELEIGGALTRSQGPGGVAQQNVMYNNIPTAPGNSLFTKMDMNWNMLLNHNFVKDLQIICEFIKNIADTYYGKQYLVKLPDMVLYRDRQYSSISIPASFSSISVYVGSNKLFGNYEIAEDGAWEEPGNYIDDCVVVGDNFSKVFTNDKGLISPIVGYNNSLNIDDVRKKWCQLDANTRMKALFNGAVSDAENTLMADLESLSFQINNILNPLFNGPLFPGDTRPLNDRELSSVNSLIQPIFGRFKKSVQSVGLKQLKIFGATINCYSSISKRKIQESWNNMLSSMHNSVQNLQTGDTTRTLADQWHSTINNTARNIQRILDTELLDFGVPSLDLSGLADDSDHIVVPVSSKKEPFGRKSPRSSKLYSKCSTGRIVFMNLINFTDPRAIMILNNKLNVFDSSFSYSKDPGISVISNIAIEDSAIYIRLKNTQNFAREARNSALERGDNRTAETILNNIKILSKNIDYIRMLKNYIVPEIDPRFLIVTGPTANPSFSHAMMSPRAAHPCFFAVPLKSNQFCYGPWSNYADNIISTNYINNLIHKVSVEQNNEFVPWNYGGSSALDTAISYQLNADINYQTILENGRISIIGPPVFGLGGVFHNDPSRIVPGAFRFDNGWYKPYYAPYKFFDTKRVGYREIQYDCIKLVHKEVSSLGPLISNINIQVGNDNIVTSYSFQTYNPKTGLYNKTYEDAIKKIAKDREKFQTAIANIQKKIDSNIISQSFNIINKAKSDRFPKSVSQYQTSLYGQSPVEIFVGQGIESLKNPVWYSHLQDYEILDVGDNPLPKEDKKDLFLNQKRHYSWVGAVEGIEIGAELQREYSSKSAMSLDGLLSPVSLYPTPGNRTYNISTYVAGDGVPVGTRNTNTSCPYCYNKKIITIPYVNYFDQALEDVEAKNLDIPCPVCSRAKIEVTKKDKNPDKESGLPDINLYSLNPIVVSSGEFRNPNASGTDRCRHSISVVSRGEYNPIDESFYINTNINTYRDGHNADFSRFDTKVKEVDNINVLLNQRFLALRGPMMLHGWGYDIDGYPVPNLLDMPYSINDHGLPLRFVIATGADLSKHGYNDTEQPGKYLPVTGIQNGAPLGDIITKRYFWSGTEDGIDRGNGRWVKKDKPSKKFYLNWAERQDLWPVGPIDLRWDNKRKVWDASGGCKEEILPPFIVTNKNDANTLTEFLNNKTENKCPYKMIYITLEQDMLKQENFESTIPARGFIDDIEYSKEPLQNNYRRLVYVIDTAGYTAPRGTKLLCRYNRDNGFYEPITKPILTAIGNISGTTAKIQMSYTAGRRSGVIPEYVSVFDNPLGLQARNNDKGLFNYINGKWTLISTG